MRVRSIATGVVFVVLSACGGGGGGSSSDSKTGSAVVQEACGTTAPLTPVGSAANVQPIQVAASVGNSNVLNTLMTTIQVCNPNTNGCVTIPNVQVDTGSTGLRILSSKLATLGLTAMTDGGGNPLGECLPFADGLVWGGLAQAYVKFTNGATTSVMTMQVIADQGTPTPTPPAPVASLGLAGCNGSTLEDSATALGVNGIIGVGLFLQDCGPFCANNVADQAYYSCPVGQQNTATQSSCDPIMMSITQQVSNPVANLASNNNGVIIEMGAVPATGLSSADGYMIFGIAASGSGVANTLPSSVPVLAVPDTDTGLGAGVFTATFNGMSDIAGFFDSGSSALFLPDTTTPTCAGGFFCPTTTQDDTASITGSNGSGGQVEFKIANAGVLFQNGINAFNDIGAPATGSGIGTGVDLGMPFFFGRTIYTGFETQTTVSPAGPFFACTAHP